MAFSIKLSKFEEEAQTKNMSNFDLNENQRFEKVDKEILDSELFSLKFTDSLYKKDIGRFLEYLSSYFI